MPRRLLLSATPPSTRRARAATVALLMLAGTVGCSVDAGSPVEDVAAPSPRSAPDGPVDASEPAAPEVDPDEGGAATGSLEQCLVGVWELDDAAWQAGIAALVSTDVEGAEVDSAGTLTLALDEDQRYAVTGAAFDTVTTGASSGAPFRWTLGFDGEETGTWYLLSEILILDRGPASAMRTTNAVEIDGEALESPATDPSSSPWSDDLGIRCDAGSLTATPLNEPTAIPLEFRRR